MHHQKWGCILQKYCVYTPLGWQGLFYTPVVL